MPKQAILAFLSGNVLLYCNICRFLRGPLSHAEGLTQNRWGRPDHRSLPRRWRDGVGVSRRWAGCSRSAVGERLVRWESRNPALNRVKSVDLTGITKKENDNGALRSLPETASLDTLVV